MTITTKWSETLTKQIITEKIIRPRLLYASAYVGFAMIAFSIILAAASTLPWRKKERLSLTVDIQQLTKFSNWAKHNLDSVYNTKIIQRL